MLNILIFAAHIAAIGGTILTALYLGQEALIALIAILTIITNLFVTKQITLFGLHVTATDAFAVGSVLAMNIVQEYYGNATARKAIIIGFFGSLFFTLASIIHLCYIPNSFDQCHPHFVSILQPMPRIIAASLITYFLAQNLDYALFNFFKKKFPTRTMISRYCSSTVISQLFDTVLFSFLGLYGVVHNIGHLIIVSYSIKFLVIMLSVPFAWLSRRVITFKGHTS